MSILVNLLISLTHLFGGNLGLTLIFIGIFSRVIFYPLLKSSYKFMEVQRRMKPQLAALKKKYANNRQKLNEAQAKLMMESGFNPLAGCLAPLVQIAVAFFLFIALRSLIESGVETHFLNWDLSKADVFRINSIPFELPGVIVLVYALTTLVQSKMMIPPALPVEKNDSKTEIKEKEDLADTLAASQGQFVYLMPLIILFTVRLLPSGLSLFLLVNTLTGIVLQYFISGWGGLESWLKIVKK